MSTTSNVSSAVASAFTSALSSTAPTTQVGPQANDSQMNQFLQLLTTQLQNQDPMQPTDPTQFVAQLAQFSTVEQLVQSNTSLTSMNHSVSSLALGQYAGMINHTVNATVSSVAVPASGSVSENMNYQVTSSALKDVQIAITNSSGTVVGTIPVTAASGTVTFDGTNGNGQSLMPGTYTISLVGADASGATQTAGTLTMSGTVSSVVQDSSGNWQLQLQGGRTVDATSVTSLS